MTIQRGDILFVDFEPVKGSELGRKRPCIVVQNDIGNSYSNTIIVVPITSRISEKYYPTDVFIAAGGAEVKVGSTVNCSQITTVSISRVIKKLGSLKPETMVKVDEALKVSLALD